MTPAGTRAALDAFGRALALDSMYTLAWAGLAMASADMHHRFASGADVAAWGERAPRAARRALELDSTVAEAHLAMAAVARKTEFDWEETLESSRRALELNPSLELAHYFRAAAFYHLGLLKEAARELALAAEIKPETDLERIRTAGVIAFLEGEFAKAVGLLDEVRRTSGEQVADFYRAEAYYYGGDAARAEAILDTLARSPSASASNRGRAALAGVIAGRDPARARDLLRTIEASGYMDHHVAYGMGAAFAQLGELRQALHWLERAVNEGFPCYPWIARDPLLDPLRREPEFRRWDAAARSRWEAVAIRFGA